MRCPYLDRKGITEIPSKDAANCKDCERLKVADMGIFGLFFCEGYDAGRNTQ